MCNSGVWPLQMQPPAVFIGYRTVDRKAHLSCTYLKAVEPFLSATRSATRGHPGRPRLHWAGNPASPLPGLPARCSRPAPSSGLLILIRPRSQHTHTHCIDDDHHDDHYKCSECGCETAVSGRCKCSRQQYLSATALLTGKHIFPAPI